jgi:formyltetrahydrofolate-dependent phosphoribosylglycinamide formyltransferase
MKRLRMGVMISGTGRTLKNFIDGIREGDLPAEIPLVISSDPEAYGITYAKEAGIPWEVISPGDHRGVKAYSEAIVAPLREARVDLVCMAGFIHLWTIPEDLEGKVMNIHPALIPSFCGKGFYGSHVHETALERGVKVSGCTVHFADNVYDHGPIILQKAVPVLEGDDPDSLATRIFEKECEAYPEAIRLFAEGRLRIRGRRVEVLPGNPADT